MNEHCVCVCAIHAPAYDVSVRDEYSEHTSSVGTCDAAENGPPKNVKQTKLMMIERNTACSVVGR